MVLGALSSRSIRRTDMNLNTCIGFHIMETEEKYAAVVRELRKAKEKNRVITEAFVKSVFANNSAQITAITTDE